MIGPRCDYQKCPRHQEQIERGSLTRGYYCAEVCREDETMRRYRARTRAAAEAKLGRKIDVQA